MKYRQFALIILIGFLFVGAGETDPGEGKYVPGALIVQFDNRPQARGSIVDEFSQHFSSLEMQSMRCLSRRLNIWLMEYNPGLMRDDAVLKETRNYRGVVNAQFNHYISLRETDPDDPSFGNQWALKNTGQTGGTEDADIDATDAWDIVTGGLTTTGDTIIIAIVDDGFDLNHEDLDFWKNYHDIPNNGIDDDTNGYVDDYHGWNAYANNGSLPSQDHGTHVTGIAGATGNNGIGVSGVNWGAKILPVAASSTQEAIAVAGYSYVYEMRARFNETNGQQGAFVVSSNSSFGVNQGNPEDYPVWEAMIDSLGEIGVLSIGATANANWDIDEVGDIPTGFESPFLISVTNTTHDDEKYLPAGYGLESIDLGAPGKSVFSTRVGNSYGNKTGTSMSAPHVSGAVALLYAAAEPSFIENYKENPEELCLLVKHYILKGVDTLSTLMGKTVSGGRLNVFNSIGHLLAEVLAADKDTITITVEVNKADTSSFLLYNVAEIPLDYTIDEASLPDWATASPLVGTIDSAGSERIFLDFSAAGLGTGIYNGVLTAENIRGDVVFIYLRMSVIPPAIIENPVEYSFIERAYPNPFHDHVNIIIDAAGMESLSIDIIDINGKLIRSFIMSPTAGNNLVIRWDGRDNSGQRVADGIYYLRLGNNGKTETVKLICLP